MGRRGEAQRHGAGLRIMEKTNITTRVPPEPPTARTTDVGGKVSEQPAASPPDRILDWNWITEIVLSGGSFWLM